LSFYDVGPLSSRKNSIQKEEDDVIPIQEEPMIQRENYKKNA